tara:strand:+ start:229 stop:393 length:165 start_codon:yes stop_codon:yes gene_type:complete
MHSNPTYERSGFITARASTAERMTAEKLQQMLGLKTQSQLVRSLIIEKAEEMGV